MAKLPPIALLEWAEQYRGSAKHDLTQTSAAPISIDQLLEMSEHRGHTEKILSLNSIKLDYNEPASGNLALRANLAGLYSARQAGVAAEHVIITNGATAAIKIAFSALVGAGDHVVCQYPVSESLHRVPSSLGAAVDFWRADPTKKWQLDVEELKTLVKENTKIIVLQTPCDPTGLIVPNQQLEDVVELAREKHITLIVDESYRPLFHSILPSSDDFAPSAINFGYSEVVVIGSMSKAYSLAGIRVGWLASRSLELIGACNQARHHTTMTVSRLDEAVAAAATSDECIHALLARNIKHCQTNLEVVQSFVDEHSWGCSWAKPLAGTTAMLKFHKMGKVVDEEVFCTQLHKEAGIAVVPASVCFGDRSDFRGWVRVAFGEQTADVKAAFQAWSSFMEESFDTVPTVSKKTAAAA